MLVNLHETGLAKVLRGIDSAIHAIMLIVAEIALVVICLLYTSSPIS